MPPKVLRESAKAPSGEMKHIQISLDSYSKEDAERIIAEWKRCVEGGVPAKVEDRSIKPSFIKKKALDIRLPSNGGASFLVLGSTRSGKSVAMCHLYEKYFKKHITFLMTHSTQAEIYKPLQKTAIISPGYHKELIEEPMKINRETKNSYEFCLIFDDLSLTGKNDKEMTKLLTIGRNSNMSAIITGQKMTMLNATGRANCNYILCFKQNTDSAITDTIKTYMRSYFPTNMTLVEMVACYKQMTQDHHFFVIDTLNDEMYTCKIDLD